MRKSCKKLLSLCFSLESVLNFLNLYTIFLIMRYNTVFSLILILGVFITPFLNNYKRIYQVLAIFFVIPAFLELFALYLYNIDSLAEILDFSDLQKIVGFQKVAVSLEYLFLMSYLTINMAVFRAFPQVLQRQTTIFAENATNFSSPPSLLFIVTIMILRNSDIVSFFILFWISLFTVNLIHSILVVFFFVFLFIKVTYFPNIVDPKKLSFLEIKLLYWKFLIGYLNILIFAK